MASSETCCGTAEVLKSPNDTARVDDLLISHDVGTGLVKGHYRKRTVLQYLCLLSMGLLSFYRLKAPALRAAGLGLVFPGAGLIAAFTPFSLLAFGVSCYLFPKALFYWLGMGAVLYPLVLWVLTAVLAAYLARDDVFEPAGIISAAVAAGVVVYIANSIRHLNKASSGLRIPRNERLKKALTKSQPLSEAASCGTHEADLQTLRFVQWLIELGLTPKTDFSYHELPPKFSQRALKIQLFEVVTDLALYQYTCCPNFHGYLSRAQRSCIEKTMIKEAMGCWKWESITGNFNVTDWNPHKRDNIMVTGYILQAAALYQSNTGDDRYSKKDSMVFEITENVSFRSDIPSMADAVYENMNNSDYCLYPCQPGWIFPPCNLVGISGIVVADRLFQKDYGDQLRARFTRSLERDFTRPDGTIMSGSCQLTGFSVPTIWQGPVFEAANATRSAPYLPQIGQRLWSFTREETVTEEENAGVVLNDVYGPGTGRMNSPSYKPADGIIHPYYAAAATEYGDGKIGKKLLKQLDEEYHPIERTATGALRNKGLGVVDQAVALRTRVGKARSWAKMHQDGLPENVSRGPVLDEAPFPDVLVAKACSPDGVSLDVVLYDGAKPGVFELRFARLRPGSSYSVGHRTVKANKDGTAKVEIEVRGRTVLSLKLEA